MVSRESTQDLNVLRGIITPMHFDSLHTNPTIKSMSLHREETKDFKTQFTENQCFTFRDNTRDQPSRGSPSNRYTSRVYDDLDKIEPDQVDVTKG